MVKFVSWLKVLMLIFEYNNRFAVNKLHLTTEQNYQLL